MALDEQKELTAILERMKLDYLTEMGARGGSKEGYLAWVREAFKSDKELRRVAEQAFIDGLMKLRASGSIH